MTSEISGMTLHREPFTMGEYRGEKLVIRYVTPGNQGQRSAFTTDVTWLHKVWPDGHSANKHAFKLYTVRVNALLDCARASK